MSKDDKGILLSHPYGFWIAGLLLLLAFLVTGGIWLAIEHYRVRVEMEYREAIDASFSQNADRNDQEQLDKVSSIYWSHDFRRFRTIQTKIQGVIIVSAVGLFFWIIFLLQKGILRLVGR